jgi:cytochrome c553
MIEVNHTQPGVRKRRKGYMSAALIIGMSMSAAALRAQTSVDAVPAWLFPMNPPEAANAPAADERTRVRVPHSEIAFEAGQLTDLFYAPDWFPRSHGPLPDIVEHGRPPDVYACGYCHLPSGQGRPENSSLAGLSAAYIQQQVADFKSGARRSPWHGPYRPPDLMIQLAAFVTPAEVASAAEYFSKQRLRLRVRVVESVRVPRARVEGLVYAAIAGGGDERLGERLLEFAPDPVRHESRRGRSLAAVGMRIAGEMRPSLACVSCHGPALRGVGDIPGLAGRSPSYLLRQLLAFKVGTRVGQTGAPMKPVSDNLQLRDMIDAASYAASLPP